MTVQAVRLNHAVLYVRDATAAAAFYHDVLGFEVVENAFGGRAVFMRAGAGDNHHDLGLFSVGPDAPRAPRGSVGLYHLAWEVPTIDDLAAAEAAAAALPVQGPGLLVTLANAGSDADDDPERRMPVVRAPHALRVLVVGGPGKHSCVIPGFGETHSITQALVERA